MTLLAGILANPAAAGEDASLGLVSWMGRLQYYAHKLGLAVNAENRALQGYYVHEVEEVIEQLEEIKEAGGVEIGNLVKVKLVPAFETLEGAVEVGDQGELRDHQHAAAGRREIEVQAPGGVVEQAQGGQLVGGRRHLAPAVAVLDADQHQQARADGADALAVDFDRGLRHALQD